MILWRPTDEVREVAGPRQRLRDRRGAATCPGSSRRSGSGGSAQPHLGIGSDGDPAALARPMTAAIVAELADLQPGRLGGRAVRKRRCGRPSSTCARHGWTDAGRVLDPHQGRPDPADDHRARRGDGRDGQRLGHARPTSRPAAPDGTGTVSAGGREWRFQHVSIGNPQCVIDAGEELEELDLAAIGPAIETQPSFPNRTNVSFIRIDGATVRARIFERGVGETALLRDGRKRGRRRGPPARRRQPDHRRARRRRARRSRSATSLRCGSPERAEPVFGGELSERSAQLAHLAALG